MLSAQEPTEQPASQPTQPTPQPTQPAPQPTQQPTQPTEQPFAVPSGFEVKEVAPDSMVHDAFCMTLDAEGRPVVSGPGYIRTLIDEDSDGSYDRYVQWASLPKDGAQGLWSEGQDLYWVGDEGLWKSRDANRDLIGDGAPTKIFALPTGEEHDAHAIRRGPDGYWYLIVGNFAKGIPSLLNDPSTFVPRPRAGTLWRISPDFKTRSVYAHGLRNAYDFDFLPSGEIVTFDSDGERDITLPSYRPTRIFLLPPGSDSGWVGEGWKDADSRVTMPQVLADLGRGSPTGVAVYRHYAFPEKYRHAIFALDWTFGRILCLYPEYVPARADSTDRTVLRMGAENFLETKGTVGFAPTDICIAPDGSLLVCVGGRGTRGAIYRIRYQGDSPMAKPKLWSDAKADKLQPLAPARESLLESIVFAPCPNEAWSEAKWRSAAADLEWTNLANAILARYSSEDGRAMTPEARLGAFQILMRSGSQLAASVVAPLLASGDSDLQSMAWRAIGLGRVAMQPKDVALFQAEVVKLSPTSSTMSNRPSGDWGKLLGDQEARARAECIGMLRWPLFLDVTPTRTPEARHCGLRHSMLWASSRVPPNRATPNAKEPRDALYGRLLYGSAPTRLDSAVLDSLAKQIAEKQIGDSNSELIEVLTLVQAALGDPRHTVPPQENTANPSIFDGYIGRFSDQVPSKARESWVQWLIEAGNKAKQNGQLEVYQEAIRAIAMFKPGSTAAIDCCLQSIDVESHPTFDIHALVCLACCTSRRDATHTQATTTALLSLHDKVRSRGLNIDNHWKPRLTQLLERLFQVDTALPKALVAAPEFGSNEDLLIAEILPGQMKSEARNRIASSLHDRPVKEWSAALLRFAVGTELKPATIALLRTAGTEPALRATALELLSKKPLVEDYELYLEALASSDRSAWKPAWDALRSIPIRDPQKELTRLVMHAVRNNGSVTTYDSQLYSRLRNAATQLKWKSIPTANSTKTWCEYVQQHLSPEEYASIDAVHQPAGKWLAQVEAANAIQGDASRGKLLFAQAKCSQCHGGGTALGPDLAGITKRFSREDLFRAIFEPNADISDRYRAMRIITSDGEVITGLNIYHAADGITLQTADGTLARINQDDIERREEANESIMPSGLLDGWSPQQIADLYAYIKSL